MTIGIILGGLCLLFISLSLWKGLKMVSQQEAWVVQKLGKFDRILKPGLNFVPPFTQKIAYIHSLKEEAIDIHAQTAITQDNVTVVLDGVLYVKIVDPFAASYGVKNPHYAVTQLVKTTMRSEIGKIPLDKTFEERESLNAKIVQSINESASAWGIKCLRYEIKDITIPDDIRKAMELQMTAERHKRAKILESEGFRQSQINESEGKRQAEINLAEALKYKTILESEGNYQARVLKAKGDAEAMAILAAASADEIEKIAMAIQKYGGDRIVALRIAEKYIDAFKQLAQKGTTVMLPSDVGNPAAMISQAMAIFDSVKKQVPLGDKVSLKEVLIPSDK
jgi:regulator of protease activity HflC (stomatin/prohibitin superfamily)